MKPNKICIRCIQFYTCNLTRVTDQCPIVNTKPPSDPFEKEFKEWDKRDRNWRFFRTFTL